MSPHARRSGGAPEAAGSRATTADPDGGADGGADASAGVHRTIVVDDTPDIRELLSLVLVRAPDFDVVGEAANGRMALAVAERERPQVVLLDLAMPIMDGLEALPRLRDLLPEATIVVLSGFGSGAMAKQAFRAGADAYLEKGTPVRRILDRVREAVAQRDPDPGPPTDRRVPVQTAPPAPAAAPPASPAVDREPEGDELVRLRRAIATTAHEIRNPVTVLRGVLEAFDEDFDDLTPERRRRLVDAFGRQVQLLDSMCADLLTATHAGRARLEIAPTVFDLVDALRGIVADRPGVTLYHEDAELPVRADRGRLEQMVSNLLTNAAKYGAPPVDVRAHPDDAGRVRVSVCDRGPGVPEEFQPRLFEEFARADTKTRVAGNGLGLFVVRHLAEAHGGRARYADRPGGGAVFAIDVARA